jgi:hypothetical protein
MSGRAASIVDTGIFYRNLAAIVSRSYLILKALLGQ